MRLPISVLIPTFNRPHSLERTLREYLNKKNVPFEIIIVDQSINSETKTIVEEIQKKYSYSNIIYIHQNEISSTSARNHASAVATQDILVFSDDDVDVFESTLINVYNIMQDSFIALVAGKDVQHEEKTRDRNNEYILGLRTYKYRNIGHVTASVLGAYPLCFEGSVETQWAMGYFFAVRKSLLQKWNIKWDEKLKKYAYAEDLDFSYRYWRCAAKANYKCILSNDVQVKHLVSREYRIPTQIHMIKYIVNREYLSYKLGLGFKSRLACRWTNFTMLINMVLHKHSPTNIIKAQIVCDKYRRRLKQGDFSFIDKYEE